MHCSMKKRGFRDIFKLLFKTHTHTHIIIYRRAVETAGSFDCHFLSWPKKKRRDKKIKEKGIFEDEAVFFSLLLLHSSYIYFQFSVLRVSE